MNKNHIILVVLDGLGDQAVKSLGSRTPLEAALTPNLDRAAKEGRCGLVEPVFKGLFPTSKDAHLSLFGYSLSKWDMGRGVVEAVGLGIKLKENDIAFRGDWATVNQNLEVVDRRAGRITETKPLVRALKKINRIAGVKFIIKPGIEHRFVLVMRGKGLSDQVSANDWHQTGVKVPMITSLDKRPDSRRTAEILNEFISRAHQILENSSFNLKRKEKKQLSANYLLVRGAGRFKDIPSFQKKWGLAAYCITGGGLYQGIARMLKMEEVKVEGANGRVTTNLKGKFKAAIRVSEKAPFLFLHIKGTDSLSHDGNCQGKKEFIEKIDQAIKPLFSLKEVTVIVTADHCTPCESKQHSTDLIPLLIWSKNRRGDEVEHWGEKECPQGSLGIIQQNQLIEKVLADTV